MIDCLINCSFGIGFIDQSLEGLISEMNKPEAHFNALEEQMLNVGRAIGLILAYCVAAYSCWEMMLGRRGLDVMKLLRILAISMCITFSPQICSMLRSPGDALAQDGKELAYQYVQSIDDKNRELTEVQQEYQSRVGLFGVDNVIAVWKNKDYDLIDKISTTIDNLNPVTKAVNGTVQWVVSLVVEFVQWLIRFLGELIFQFMLFGLFLAQAFILRVLTIFAPLAFALSLAPPFKNAWSQWVGKFVSVSLWGILIWMALIYVSYILSYCIEMDIDMYKSAIDNGVSSTDQIKVFLSNALGSTCYYVMALCAGSYVLKFVPELASWLIPGGASASLGGSAAGAGAGAITGTLGAAGAVAGVAAVAATGGAATPAVAAGAASVGLNAGQGLSSMAGGTPH